MRVYLAGGYVRRAELCWCRIQLLAAGVPVTASWLDETDEYSDPRSASVQDVADLLAADTLVAFTDPPGVGNPRGGRHVEFGIAVGVTFAPVCCAAPRPLRIVLVGPRENIFHHLPGLEQYDDWPTALAALLAPKGGSE